MNDRKNIGNIENDSIYRNLMIYDSFDSDFVSKNYAYKLHNSIDFFVLSSVCVLFF